MKVSTNVPHVGPIASDRIVTWVDMAENVSKRVTLGTTRGAVGGMSLIRTLTHPKAHSSESSLIRTRKSRGLVLFCRDKFLGFVFFLTSTLTLTNSDSVVEVT